MTLKVTPAQTMLASKASKKLSSDEIAQKVAKKFGADAKIKKVEAEPSPDVRAEISSQETIPHSDIGVNDPNNELTHAKLKGLLKTGGFDFNEKERKALSQILK